VSLWQLVRLSLSITDQRSSRSHAYVKASYRTRSYSAWINRRRTRRMGRSDVYTGLGHSVIWRLEQRHSLLASCRRISSTLRRMELLLEFHVVPVCMFVAAEIRRRRTFWRENNFRFRSPLDRRSHEGWSPNSFCRKVYHYVWKNSG